MASNTDRINDTYLYIGTNPRRDSQETYASFTGHNLIPLSWYFLFSPEDAKIRREEFPEQLSRYSARNKNLDAFEQYAEEVVAFKTTLSEAKNRLAEYKSVFKGIPYIWSYFKSLIILDKELENFIERLEEDPMPVIASVAGPHPETNLSQVEFKQDDDYDEQDFAADLLKHIGEDASALETKYEPDEEEEQDTSDVFGDDLLAALGEATALEFGDADSTTEDLDPFTNLESQFEESFEATDRETQKPKPQEPIIQPEIPDYENEDLLPVIAHFDSVAKDGRGDRLAKIPLLLERLMHHAKREGEMTRIMQDLLQEIFREARSGWRITGQLAEDFVHGDPAELGDIMLGEPSVYVVIDETLDLEYWTKGTLQRGDERLMFSLTLLPSEQIHLAIKSGRLADVSNSIGNLLTSTQSITFPRLSSDLLKKPPFESSIWGFRVIIKDSKGDFRPATVLISDPAKSWKEEFDANLKLPGVLEDFHIELEVRFDEYSDIDHYQLVFEGAKNFEDTFESFVRWSRRHNIMYIHTYGVQGTIKTLRKILTETMDKQQGQLIFDMLTKLTELGFTAAMDALSDEVIVQRLPWLYS